MPTGQQKVAVAAFRAQANAAVYLAMSQVQLNRTWQLPSSALQPSIPPYYAKAALTACFRPPRAACSHLQPLRDEHLVQLALPQQRQERASTLVAPAGSSGSDSGFEVCGSRCMPAKAQQLLLAAEVGWQMMLHVRSLLLLPSSSQHLQRTYEQQPCRSGQTRSRLPSAHHPAPCCC